MEKRKALVMLFVIASCYLIFSLAPVAAYQVGDFFSQVEGKHVMLSIEPALKIIDDIRPMECGSTGAVTFRAYVDNVGEFGITGSEALIEDVYTGTYYNVTDALTCTPKTRLISNQEITCSLSVKTLLAKLPKCPLDSVENRLYVSFDISHSNMKSKVTDSRSIAAVGAGVEPAMEVDFAISQPPYPIPLINCNTGSEIDVPVVIHHAEKLFGGVQWSFAANGTSSNAIECSKLLSRTGEGREDIYLCMLTVSSTLFTKCEEGIETTVAVYAKSGDYNLTGEFTTTLTSQDLDLRIKISDLETVECQIVSEDGLCIPRDPQRNVTVTITGNVPERLKVFESRYKIDSANTTTLLCNKLSSSRYQCMTFITLDNLPVPSNKSSTTTKTREITVYFDVKYLNYYTSISAKTDFEMEGTALDELIDTINLLKKDESTLSAIKNITDWYMEKAYIPINTLEQCCTSKDFAKNLKEKKYGKILLDFAKAYFVGNAETGWGAALNIITQNGPGIVSCVAEKGMKDVQNQIDNLKNFEGGTVTSEIKIPSVSEMFEDYIAECTAKNFWDRIKASKWVALCLLIRAVLDAAAGGLGETLCNIWNNPVFSAIRQLINMLLLIASVLLLYNGVNEALKNMALSAERINLQLAASNAMTEYANKLQNTMETLATSISINSALQNITSPVYDTVKLLFVSDRSGVLSNGDSICSKDQIAIDYDFEKLNQTQDFKSELFIHSSSRSKTLHFDALKGTYGPYDVDALLGADPATSPSELYTFTLSYESKTLDYELNYVNKPCSSS
jgi:hypothetical protein